MKWVENGESAVEFCCSNEKKNIFLIGDSIRKGYCKTVKEQLCDVAEVFYLEDNCRSTQYVIFNLKRWAGMFDNCSKVDLVQFNCGQWDTAHFNGYEFSLTGSEEYAKNILAICVMLKRFFPNAKLVFATTTPMNPDGGSTGGVNPRSNEEVDEYNRIATKIVASQGISVNDLNAFMRSWGSEYYKDTCHLQPFAFALLGGEVARYLRTKL